MSHLKVTNSNDHADGMGMVGYGTIVELDGREVRNVRSIELGPITIDDIMTAKIEVLASDEYVLDVHASVQVVVVAVPGYQVIEAIDLDSGRKTYSVVPCEVAA